MNDRFWYAIPQGNDTYFAPSSSWTSTGATEGGSRKCRQTAVALGNAKTGHEGDTELT